jgi:anti-sigma regulatory factor (Ser/Thr protein kinase)
VSATAVDAARRVIEFTRPSTMTPGQARRWVCRELAAWGVPADAVDGAAVIVSELVTNACLHGPSDAPVVVTVRRVSGGVEVAVHDQGRIPPERWTPRLGDECGRGLALVEALAVRFDIEMHRWGGKTCSAVLGVDGLGVAA